MNGIAVVKLLMVMITLGLGWFAWSPRNKPVHSYVFWSSVFGLVAAGTLRVLFIVWLKKTSTTRPSQAIWVLKFMPQQMSESRLAHILAS